MTKSSTGSSGASQETKRVRFARLTMPTSTNKGSHLFHHVQAVRRSQQSNPVGNLQVNEQLRVHSVNQSFCGTHSAGSLQGTNPFVFDINIRLQRGSNGQLQKIMKRVLIDTGSDLNLISAAAHADLETQLRPQKRIIRSVAGQSAVVGETNLSWTFLNSTNTGHSSQSVFSDDFFVLSEQESTLFDCILGRHWIQAHRSVFLSLWA
jgi:hypothetical protein